MSASFTVRAGVESYLSFRRKLGFALRIEGEELSRFARFAEAIGHAGPITTELAIRWASLPTHADRLYHARRLDMVRRLAQHYATFERATEIPPEGILGPSYRRREPHIYSVADVAKLLEVAGRLQPVGGLRPVTYVTLFGLLACTGLRISEALHLTRNDVDLDNGVVTIAEAKFHKSRLVPLHPTTTERLRAYVCDRDQHLTRIRSQCFFLSGYGTSVKYCKVNKTFVKLRKQIGWTKGRGERLPRIHDLRHTFVVRRLLLWYQQGVDIDHKIAALSSYLGHVKVSDTYWYMTAVPELLALSGSRFEKFATNRAGERS